MKIDWKNQPIQETEACRGLLRANFYRFQNGTEREIRTENDEQLVIILSGECDVKIKGGRYRLNTGSWINFPAKTEYGIHVFRSCGDCSVLCVSAKGDPSGVVSCNIFDLPEMNGTVYFGLECGSMTGMSKAEERCASEDELEVEIMRDAMVRQIVITAGKKGNDYAGWLKERYRILWEQSVMEI